MIRLLAEYFLYPLLILFVVRSVLRMILAAVRTPRPPARKSPEVQTGGELKKDPVCGTYVSTATSLSRTVNGKILYFCSPECRDKYKVA